jgi:hypothetical protein
MGDFDMNEEEFSGGKMRPPSGEDASVSPVLHYSTGGADAAPGGGWVHVWKAADPFEANLIVGKLQEHGLHARVDMENAAALGAWGGVGAGGTTVQTLAEDVPAARRILEQVDQDRARRRDAGSLACPQCGHRPAKRLLHPARKTAVAALVAMPFVAIIGDAAELPSPVRLFLVLGLGLATMVLFFVSVVPRWRCLACRHAWAEPDPPAADEDDEEA